MFDRALYPGAAAMPYPAVVSPADRDSYFVRREPPAGVDYEAAYWGVVTDPDGNVRDRRLERDQAVGDLSEELSAIESYPGRRVLDVGCGLGFLLSGLSPRWERHGVEVSVYASEFASREYGVRMFTGTLREGLRSGAIAEASFDVVVLHHVIEHVDRPLDLMADVERAVAPGGRLVIGTPDFDGTMARRYGARYRMLHDSTHVSLFTEESMYRLLRDRWWIVERVSHPYFSTRHFRDGVIRLSGTGLSPAFPGSWMTFYCRQHLSPPVGP